MGCSWLTIAPLGQAQWWREMVAGEGARWLESMGGVTGAKK
jgi:hypothetical protein